MDFLTGHVIVALDGTICFALGNGAVPKAATLESLRPEGANL